MVKLLLSDIRVDPSHYNNSALYTAFLEGHDDIVMLLLDDLRVLTLINIRIFTVIDYNHKDDNVYRIIVHHLLKKYQLINELDLNQDIISCIIHLWNIL